MRALRVALLALVLAHGLSLVAPTAEAEMCVSTDDPSLCPPGTIPWRTSSSHGCHAGFTCAALW